MKLDYSKLYPGVVIGTTNMHSPLAATIRATTAGIWNVMNPRISSHIVCVCRERELLYGMEMAWPKIRRIDLDDIGRIVFVGSDVLPTNYHTQEICNNFLWQSHTTAVKYDWKELLKFWGLDVYDSPRKLICSDLAREMFRKAGIAYPKAWNDKCDPYDIQRYFK